MSSLPLYRKSEMTKITTIIDDNYTSSLKICMAAAINNMRYCHDLNAMHANASHVLSFSCIIIIRNFVVVISHLKICLATAYIQSQ